MPWERGTCEPKKYNSFVFSLFEGLKHWAKYLKFTLWNTLYPPETMKTTVFDNHRWSSRLRMFSKTRGSNPRSVCHSDGRRRLVGTRLVTTPYLLKPCVSTPLNVPRSLLRAPRHSNVLGPMIMGHVVLIKPCVNRVIKNNDFVHLSSTAMFLSRNSPSKLLIMCMCDLRSATGCHADKTDVSHWWMPTKPSETIKTKQKKQNYLRSN